MDLLQVTVAHAFECAGPGKTKVLGLEMSLFSVGLLDSLVQFTVYNPHVEHAELSTSRVCILY